MPPNPIQKMAIISYYIFHIYLEISNKTYLFLDMVGSKYIQTVDRISAFVRATASAQEPVLLWRFIVTIPG